MTAPPEFRITVGDCRQLLPRSPAEVFDAIATDPPYELGFMGKSWDSTGVAFDVRTWQAALRVCKPGAYMVAMGGTRTYHRLTCAIEDAGWEIRDCLSWLYGSGFPKGQGCLKPAWEPIVLARKPGPRVLPLGVGECRIGAPIAYKPGGWHHDHTINDDGWTGGEQPADREPLGRWPANVVHDGSDEVLEAFAAFGDKKLGGSPASDFNKQESVSAVYDWANTGGLYKSAGHYCDTGTAARFYYCAKAGRREREGNPHPTVKPVALMEWLVRLVCRPGGRVLDLFGGSGTTGVAGKLAGRAVSLIELDPAHAAIIRRRVDAAPWKDDAGEWREPVFGEPAPPLWEWPDLSAYRG